jgi:hypothetical protein
LLLEYYSLFGVPLICFSHVVSSVLFYAVRH